MRDNYLFSLCYIQLLEIKNRLDGRRPLSPTHDEAHAQLKIVECLFELAAGAAVRKKLGREQTKALVELVEEIRDWLEWNAVNPK